MEEHPNAYEFLSRFLSYNGVAGGTFVFKDPVAGSPIEPGNIPICIIEEDPVCAKGLDTLRWLGAQRLDIRFLFGSHGNPNDFNQFVGRQETRDILAQAQVVAIEANGNPNNISLAGEGTPRRQFQDTQIRWLANNNITILPCDIDLPTYPDDPGGGTLRQTMVKVFELANSADDPYVQAALSLYYHAIREEMMLGQLGHWLGNFCANKPPGRILVPFMVGSAHQSLVPKAEKYLGYKPKSYNMDPDTPYTTISRDAIMQGQVTLNQLFAYANSP